MFYSYMVPVESGQDFNKSWLKRSQDAVTAVSVCIAAEAEGNGISSENHFFFLQLNILFPKVNHFTKPLTLILVALLAGESWLVFPYLTDQER